MVMRRRRAASASTWALWSTTSGSAPPTAWGQKYCSWRSAAEWKVRACTPWAPRSLSRARISEAARAVKVTARVRWGS